MWYMNKRDALRFLLHLQSAAPLPCECYEFDHTPLNSIDVGSNHQMVSTRVRGVRARADAVFTPLITI
jgi:hypothetical protein